MFDSSKRQLKVVLEAAAEGRLQLPDFQRGWIWDDDHIRSLIASIARSFPIGAVMLLENGGENRFQTRPVEGVRLLEEKPPEELILDGQQRITTLTRVLILDTPVKTRTSKGKEISVYYYFDIQKALKADDPEEAIIVVDSDKKQRANFGRDVVLDLSSIQLECGKLMFPCNRVFDADDWEETLHDVNPEAYRTYMAFRKKVLNAFRSYELPVIKLLKDTSKEAVCMVFEKVNTGGVALTVFELVTASFAAEGFNLRNDWYGVGGRKDRLMKNHLVSGVEPTDFLQTVCLLWSLNMRQRDLAAGKTGKAVTPVSANRATILKLPLAEYRKRADRAEDGFTEVNRFLHRQGFFHERDIPYRTQLVPLAAVMADIGERWLEPRVFGKLSRWFWCGVFGELYGGTTDTRIANDYEDLLAWFDDDERVPRTVRDAVFSSSRLITMRSRLSAAYKGLSVLLVREGARDFFWKTTIRDLDLEEASIDIHHIFPREWCRQQGIDPHLYDCSVNKTMISAKANRMVGAKAPSKYLEQIQRHAQVGVDDAEMASILASHHIDAAALRRDDFDAFFSARREALLDLIERAMGKGINRDEPDDEYESFPS